MFLVKSEMILWMTVDESDRRYKKRRKLKVIIGKSIASERAREKNIRVVKPYLFRVERTTDVKASNKLALRNSSTEGKMRERIMNVTRGSVETGKIGDASAVVTPLRNVSGSEEDARYTDRGKNKK